MFWLLSTAYADDCGRVPDLLERLEYEGCPTTTLLQLAELRCDDDRLAPFARRDTPMLAPLPPAGGKGLRDSYSMPLSQESENFVLRWSGNSWPSSRADAVLEAMESAWSLILEDMAYRAPDGSDEYKFNVYIGDTGGPGAYGSAYYTRDSSGWPMVVITPGTFEDVAMGSTVGAHEFFHALQDAAGAPYAYTDDSPGAWYWEATANWVETAIYPENRAQTLAGFLIGYALLPQLPIHFFDYPDSGSLQEYHQYGAFIFPYYLTREIADNELIRESWMEASSDDPLIELDGRLQSGWGVSIDDAFFDFAASNVTWEAYDDGDVFDYYVTTYEEYYPDLARRIATVGPDSGGWVDAPSSTLPQRYGTNNLVISPEGSDLFVSFDGEAVGSRGGAATWDVRAVLVTGETGTTQSFTLSGGSGTLDLVGAGDVDEVWVVVSVVSPSTENGETFSWSYSVGESEEKPADTGSADTGSADTGDAAGPDADAGCGCQGNAAFGLPLLLPLAWGRRRR